jgi:hypothetical protein
MLYLCISRHSEIAPNSGMASLARRLTPAIVKSEAPTSVERGLGATTIQFRRCSEAT